VAGALLRPSQGELTVLPQHTPIWWGLGRRLAHPALGFSGIELQPFGLVADPQFIFHNPIPVFFGCGRMVLRGVDVSCMYSKSPEDSTLRNLKA